MSEVRDVYLFLPHDRSEPFYALVNDRNEVIFHELATGNIVASKTGGTFLMPVAIALPHGQFVFLGRTRSPRPFRFGHIRMEPIDGGRSDLQPLPKRAADAVQPYFECVDHESGYCVERFHERADAVVRDSGRDKRNGERPEQHGDEHANGHRHAAADEHASSGAANGTGAALDHRA